MAVPKRRLSRSRTRSRRAHWKAQPPALTRLVVDGRVAQVPPSLVRAVRRGLVDPES